MYQDLCITNYITSSENLIEAMVEDDSVRHIEISDDLHPKTKYLYFKK